MTGSPIGNAEIPKPNQLYAVAALKSASLEALEETHEIGPTIAQSVHASLHAPELEPVLAKLIAAGLQFAMEETERQLFETLSLKRPPGALQTPEHPGRAARMDFGENFLKLLYFLHWYFGLKYH